MEERAINERWPITPMTRLKIVERLCKVIDRGEENDRHAIGAANALIKADRDSLEWIKHDHATKPPEQSDDDFEIDISQDDPPQQADGPAA